MIAEIGCEKNEVVMPYETDSPAVKKGKRIWHPLRRAGDGCSST